MAPIRPSSLLAAALACCLLREAAADPVAITFEILPEEGGDSGPSTAEVYDNFVNAVSQRGSAISDSDYLGGLNSKVDAVQVIADRGHAAVDIEADSIIRATAQSDIQFTAGGGMKGRVVEEIDMVAGGLVFQSLGGMTAMTGDANLAAAGNVYAVASGPAEVGAASLSGRVTGDVDAAAGGSMKMAAGSDVTLESGGSGSATFSGALNLAGSDVGVSASHALSATGNVVEVRGREKVVAGSAGAFFEMSGESKLEFVGFVWRSSPGFDEFENIVPRIESASELIIRAMDGIEPMGQSNSAATKLAVDLGVVSGGSEATSYQNVWSTTIGRGAYSLDGLRITWGTELTVVAIKLSSAPFNNPSFDGFGSVLFHFGTTVATGAISVSSAGTLEAMASESISLSSESIAVAAGASLEVSAADVSVAGSTMSMQAAAAFEVSAANMNVVAHDGIDVFSNGKATAALDSLTAVITGDLAVASGGKLSAAAVSATLQVSEGLSMASAGAELSVEQSITAFAGKSASLTTQDVSLRADGTLTAFAGGAASIFTSDLSVNAVGEISVQTSLADINVLDGMKLSAASVDVVSAEKMNLAASELSLSVNDTLSIGTGGAASLHSGGDIQLSSIGGLSAHTAEELELSAGSVNLRSGGAASLLAGGEFDAAIEGNATIYTSGQVSGIMDGLSATVMQDLTATAGGNMGLWAAGEVSVAGNNGASVVLGGEATAMAAAISVAAADSLSATAKYIDVQGQDGVKVGTAGTAIELSTGADMQFVSFVWRSSSSFDSYENMIPVIAAAVELVIQSSAGSPLLVHGGTAGCALSLSVGTATDTAAVDWHAVWDTAITPGTRSLDGTRVEFPQQLDVVAVKLGSYPAMAPSFDGWGEAVFRFGTAVTTGSVSVQSAGTLEAMAAESITMASESIAVSAGSSLEVSGGELLSVMGDTVSVAAAAALEATAGSLSVTAHDGIDIVSNGKATASVDSLLAGVSGDVELSAGGGLTATAASAAVEVSGRLGLASETAGLHVDQTLTAYAGESATLSTHDASIEAGGLLSAFAGDMAKLVAGAGGVSIDSGGGVAVRTPDHSLELAAGGAATLLSRESVILDSGSLSARAGTVKIAGTGSPSSKVQFSMDYECPPGDASCSDMQSAADRAAMLEEMAEMLGVPAHRLRIAGMADVPETAPPTPAPVSIDDIQRVPGQFSGRRRQQEAEKHRRRLEEESSAKKKKELKKLITKATLEHFKSAAGAASVPKAEQRSLMCVAAPRMARCPASSPARRAPTRAAGALASSDPFDYFALAAG